MAPEGAITGEINAVAGVAPSSRSYGGKMAPVTTPIRQLTERLQQFNERQQLVLQALRAFAAGCSHAGRRVRITR